MEPLGLDRRDLRRVLILLVLVALSVAGLAMLKFRIEHTGSLRYEFMTWNLALAWIPMAAAGVVEPLAGSSRRGVRALSLLPAAVWLVFLPNAPYLATDLSHVSQSTSMPFLYDVAMMLAFAATGVLLGLASLLFMQDVVAIHAGRAASWLFVAGSLLLTSFGIYLGRVERLNSWDVFSSPAPVLNEVWLHLRDPFGSSRAFEFTLLITLMLLAAYLLLFDVTRRGLRLLRQRTRR